MATGVPNPEMSFEQAAEAEAYDDQHHAPVVGQECSKSQSAKSIEAAERTAML